MAKKIRFPLEMENGVEVRSIEELRNNFSISKVLGYIYDGKLVTWLRDRYANDIADLLDELDVQDDKLAKKVSEIFEIPYDEELELKMEKISERAKRIVLLKKYTDDKQYEAVIDNVAFNQDELYDLLDEGVKTIYLCGDKFSIPLSKEGITYFGINKPMAVIDSKKEVYWAKKGITVENVLFDEKYRAVIEEKNKISRVIIKENNSFEREKEIRLVDDKSKIIEIISNNALLVSESENYVFYINNADELEKKKWIDSRQAMKQYFSNCKLWIFNKKKRDKISVDYIDIYRYYSDLESMFYDDTNILDCSDDWFVYNNRNELYICDVKEKRINKYLFGGLALICSGKIVGEWLYLEVGTPDKLTKLNLKSFEVRNFIDEYSKEELLGDVMPEQNFIHCFIGKSWEKCTYMKIDTITDDVLEKIDLNEMHNKWLRNSFYYKNKVYYTIKHCYSFIWSWHCLDLATKEQIKIGDFNDVSVSHSKIDLENNSIRFTFQNDFRKEIRREYVSL